MKVGSAWIQYHLAGPFRRGAVLLELRFLLGRAPLVDGFATEVTSTLRQMPDSELHQLGKQKVTRSRRVFTTESKRRMWSNWDSGRR